MSCGVFDSRISVAGIEDAKDLEAVLVGDDPLIGGFESFSVQRNNTCGLKLRRCAPACRQTDEYKIADDRNAPQKSIGNVFCNGSVSNAFSNGAGGLIELMNNQSIFSTIGEINEVFEYEAIMRSAKVVGEHVSGLQVDDFSRSPKRYPQLVVDNRKMVGMQQVGPKVGKPVFLSVASVSIGTQQLDDISKRRASSEMFVIIESASHTPPRFS